jgi:hypothetical protein
LCSGKSLGATTIRPFDFDRIYAGTGAITAATKTASISFERMNAFVVFVADSPFEKPRIKRQ